MFFTAASILSHRSYTISTAIRGELDSVSCPRTHWDGLWNHRLSVDVHKKHAYKNIEDSKSEFTVIPVPGVNVDAVIISWKSRNIYIKDHRVDFNIICVCKEGRVRVWEPVGEFLSIIRFAFSKYRLTMLFLLRFKLVFLYLALVTEYFKWLLHYFRNTWSYFP